MVRAGVVACAGLATGCAQTGGVGHLPRGEVTGNQGGSWEIVLGTPETPVQTDWEYARLDDAMNIRTAASLSEDVSLDPWRPSLDDMRRFSINPRADQIIYFRRRAR